MTLVVPDPDFATRAGRQLDDLRATYVDRVWLDALRAAHASLNAQDVAAWLVGEVARWVTAPCWAVIGDRADRRPALLAGQGVDLDRTGAISAAAAWVNGQGQPLFAPDLSRDARLKAGVGAVLAVPLLSRGRTVAVLVGFDPVPSGEVPLLEANLVWMRDLLEPVAIALDNAMIIGRAEALSVTDDLTQLFNLRFLNLVLRRETKLAIRGTRPLSLLFIDLDGFKTVNDRFGHLAGSRALVETAGVIRECARETDVVARYGGDEFSVVLPETGPAGSTAVARRIQSRLRASTFLQSQGHALRLTASIGVATLPNVAGSAEELLRVADMAMYTVKAAGKNGIHVTEAQ